MSTEDNRSLLIIMTLVHMVNDGFEMVVPTLMPIMAVSIGLSYSQIGIVSGVLVLAMGLGQAFVGVGSDLIGHKKHMIIFGVVLSSIGLMVMGVSSNYQIMLLGGVLIGFGLSIYHPVSMAIITNRFISSTGRAVGIHGCGGNTGMFLFPLIAGVLADIIGWRETLFLFPIVGLVIIFVYWALAQDEKVEMGEFEPRKLMVPALAIIIISIGVFNMATRGFFTYFPVTLESIGFSASAIGVYFSSFFGIGIIGQYLGGCISDRYDNVRSLFILLLISGASMYACLQYHDGIALLSAVAVAGLCVNMIWPIFFVLYAKKTPPALRGTGFGLFFSTNYIFAASSPIIMGQLGTAYSNSAANMLVLVTCILGAITILFLKRN